MAEQLQPAHHALNAAVRINDGHPRIGEFVQ